MEVLFSIILYDIYHITDSFLTRILTFKNNIWWRNVSQYARRW